MRKKPFISCHFSTNHNAFDTRILWKQCVSLTRAGGEVTLICQLKEKNHCDEVEIAPFPTLRPRIWRMLAGPWLMLWKVWQTRADIYHFHDPELLPAGLMLRCISGKPVIFDVHEDNVTVIRERTYIPSLLRKMTESAYLFLERLARKHLTLVLAERYYARRLPEGTCVLNYPILNESKMPQIGPNSGRTQISTAAPHWLIYTGSVREDRGALHHAELIELCPEVGVLSAGICAEKLAESMQEKAHNSPRFIMEGVGNVKTSRARLDELTSKHKWLAGLALFPKTEHFAEKELTKFFEYMKDGLPILCSDMPAWKDFVESNEVGIAVAPEDPKAIQSAIDWLIDHPEERERMGANGQRLIKSTFNWQSQADKLTALYDQLLSKDES